MRNVERDPRATVAQVAGSRWLSIAGHATIERDPEAVAHAVALYAERYRPPRVNPRRVVIRLTPADRHGLGRPVRIDGVGRSRAVPAK